jgi:hypothetical protein
MIFNDNGQLGGYSGLVQSVPPDLALQREAAKQFLAYVARMQQEQAMEIHPVQV